MNSKEIENLLISYSIIEESTFNIDNINSNKGLILKYVLSGLNMIGIIANSYMQLQNSKKNTFNKDDLKSLNNMTDQLKYYLNYLTNKDFVKSNESSISSTLDKEELAALAKRLLPKIRTMVKAKNLVVLIPEVCDLLKQDGVTPADSDRSRMSTLRIMGRFLKLAPLFIEFVTQLIKILEEYQNN